MLVAQVWAKAEPAREAMSAIELEPQEVSDKSDTLRVVPDPALLTVEEAVRFGLVELLPDAGLSIAPCELKVLDNCLCQCCSSV